MKVRRLEKIEAYLKDHRLCTYEELAEYFDVSISTVHRDIEELSKGGSVKKTHGGAVYEAAKQAPDEFSFLSYNYEKDRIAKRAAMIVEDNDIVLLGSGSTVAHMVRHLKGKRNITVITNNFIVIAEAMKYGFHVINIGGNLDRTVMSFVGTQSIKQLEELNANKAFIGCNGVTANGFSNVVDLEADIKKTMIRISSHTSVLAQSKKFGAMSLYKICGLKEVDRVVTDEAPSRQFQKLFQQEGVLLEVAD